MKGKSVSEFLYENPDTLDETDLRAAARELEILAESGKHANGDPFNPDGQYKYCIRMVAAWLRETAKKKEYKLDPKNDKRGVPAEDLPPPIPAPLETAGADGIYDGVRLRHLEEMVASQRKWIVLLAEAVGHLEDRTRDK